MEEFRKQVWHQFRTLPQQGAQQWPYIYGDSVGLPGTSRLDLMLSDLQLDRLRRWAEGDFIPDYNLAFVPPGKLEDYPLGAQPAALTEANLTFCLADAFHPGCELTWIMRTDYIYSKPFRIRHRPPGVAEADFGEVLDPVLALASSGPLTWQGPGDLTRWMAVPWQTDTASCRSGYEEFTPATPTFWPARVPNHVLTSDSFDQMLQASDAQSAEAAFRRRDGFLRPLRGRFFEQLTQMVTRFGELGLVLRRDSGSKFGLPPTVLVEDRLRAAPGGGQTLAAAPLDDPAEADFNPKIDRFQRRSPH